MRDRCSDINTGCLIPCLKASKALGLFLEVVSDQMLRTYVYEKGRKALTFVQNRLLPCQIVIALSTP